MSTTTSRLNPPTGFRGPIPCARFPYAGKVHLDGPCQCFFGGPAPQFPQPLDLAAPATPVPAPAPAAQPAA